MNKRYLVISRFDDEVSNRFYTRAELEKILNNEWKNEGYEFIDSIPDDPMYFPARSVFIMHGETVLPKAERVVTKLVI